MKLEQSDREWLAKRQAPPPFPSTLEGRRRRLDEHMTALEKALGWYAWQERWSEEHGKWLMNPGVRVARDALNGKEDYE